MPMYKKPLLIVLAIALLVSGGIFFNQQEQSEQISLENNSSEIAAAPATVYVSGEVNKPGVVDLTTESRVSDAIKACGDFTASADKSSVNLAQKIEDGMQIKVLALNNAPTPNTNSANAPANGDTINLNTATEEELDKLPGIGPAMAKRIIEYRQTNGNFKSIDEIKNVRGIGEGKFSKMQDKLSIWIN